MGQWKLTKFLFLVDFIVIDIEEDNDITLIRDRPFMKIARTMINIDNWEMNIKV